MGMHPQTPRLPSGPARDFLLTADILSSPPSLESHFFDDFVDSPFDIQGILLSPKDSPNGNPSPTAQPNYVGPMSEVVNSGARRMSQSSNEREMSTDVKPPPKDGSLDPEPDSRSLKRKYTNDVVDYPRRRATIAVR